MTLELVVGPVRSGKLGVLLDRFAAACASGERPLLMVPAAFERDALEREACAAAGALLGGEVVTLDTLVERVLDGDVEVASDALERVLRRRVGQSLGAGLGMRPVALASALERLARECDRAGAASGALERAPAGDSRLAAAYGTYEAALDECGRARRGRLWRVPPTDSSGSLRRGTERPCSHTGSTMSRPRSCGCWPPSPGAAA